jgi:hypothetical protein
MRILASFEDTIAFISSPVIGGGAPEGRRGKAAGKIFDMP